jgi:D-alanine-D-alanine ligase
MKMKNKIEKFVIKPIDEGSSVGVEVILKDNNEFDITKYNWKYGDQIIIEKYIKGKELQVAIIEDKAVGSVEVRPKFNLFYDYASKYTAGMTDYIIPPEIPAKKNKELLALGLKCHQMVGCKDISRVDFLLNEVDNKIYLLEINTHPGFTPLSLVPKIAKKSGISFNEIVEYLINNASCNK